MELPDGFLFKAAERELLWRDQPFLLRLLMHGAFV